MLFKIITKEGTISIEEKSLEGTYFAKYLREGSYESKHKEAEMGGWSREVISLYLKICRVDAYTGNRFEEGEKFDHLLAERVELLLFQTPELIGELEAFGEYTQDETLKEVLDCAKAFLEGELPDNYKELETEHLRELSRWLGLSPLIEPGSFSEFAEHLTGACGIRDAPWIPFALDGEFYYDLPKWGMKYVRIVMGIPDDLLPALRDMPNLVKLGLRFTENAPAPAWLPACLSTQAKLKELDIEGLTNLELRKALFSMIGLKKLRISLGRKPGEIGDILPYPEGLESLECKQDLRPEFRRKLVGLKSLTISDKTDLRGMGMRELTLKEHGYTNYIPPSVEVLNLLNGFPRGYSYKSENVKSLSIIGLGLAEGLSGFPNVETLHLEDWEESPFPNVLEISINMPKVRILEIVRLAITPEDLGKFPNLEELMLNEVEFEGEFVPPPKLERLSVRNTPGLSREVCENLPRVKVEWSEEESEEEESEEEESES